MAIELGHELGRVQGWGLTQGLVLEREPLRVELGGAEGMQCRGVVGVCRVEEVGALVVADWAETVAGWAETVAGSAGSKDQGLGGYCTYLTLTYRRIQALIP